jgi:Ala-tRNA(Pro) deacylase
MNLQSYLDDLGVHYSTSHHRAVYSAHALAEVEHLSGHQVVKPVLIQADGRFILCALPASYRIDLEKMRSLLNAQRVVLAREREMRQVFPDCELGAEPPIGRMYGLQTFVDSRVFQDEGVIFQAGSHENAIAMPMSDYRRAVQPQIANFALPA